MKTLKYTFILAGLFFAGAYKTAFGMEEQKKQPAPAAGSILSFLQSVKPEGALQGCASIKSAASNNEEIGEHLLGLNKLIAYVTTVKFEGFPELKKELEAFQKKLEKSLKAEPKGRFPSGSELVKKRCLVGWLEQLDEMIEDAESHMAFYGKFYALRNSIQEFLVPLLSLNPSPGPSLGSGSD